MKEPVIERKINQLRDGSLNRKFGSPVKCLVEVGTACERPYPSF